MRSSFSIGQKRRALALIQNFIDSGHKHPYAEAAEAANVNRNTLSKWHKSRANIIDAKSSSIRKLHRGPAPKRPEIEQSVVKWVEEKRLLNLPVNASTIATFVRQQSNHGFDTFESTRSWVYRMMPRNGLAVRRKTHDATALTEHQMGQIHLHFVECVRELIDQCSIEAQRIVNMDETGCYFDAAIPTTIDFKGLAQYLLA